jgi:hypothetical protein
MTKYGIALEFIVAIIATIFYKKIPLNFRRYFLSYLYIICLVEISGHFIKKAGLSNTWVYNTYTFFEFNLIFLMYYSITKDKLTKNIIKIFAIVLNLTAIFSIVYFGIHKYISLSVVVGSFFVTTILLLYLKEFINSDKILNYTRSIYFWLTVGLLVYYFGSIPFQTVIDMNISENLRVIQFSLGVFSYLSIIIGLIWSQKEAN